MRKFFILALVLLSFQMLIAQQNTGYYQPKTLVLKVKPEYRPLCYETGIKLPELMQLFATLEVSSLYQMFPKQQAPQKEFDKFGNRLVDISLIYKLEYESAFDEHQVIYWLQQTGFFEYAERFVVPEIMYQPNDPQLSNQYALTTIKAFQAWDICQGDTNYVIGITDTGIDFTHLDLVNSVKYNYNDTIDGIDNDNDGYIDNYMGWNMGSWNNNPQWGTVGHGVHVCGIAGATTNNGYGMAGSGFKCKILPVRIDDVNGVLTKSYEGLIYAVNQGVQVVNCSWGSTFSPGQFGQDIVNYATFNKNCLVVAAAGNANDERMYYPASYQNVLCVAASKSTDEKWENSSYYWRVDISAPGHNIYSTWPGGAFITSSGTSMASPLTAGAAALIRSYYPDKSPLEIIHILKNSSDNIYSLPANANFIDKLGRGRLNMFRALTDTMKPGISLRQPLITDNNDNIFIMNDTLYIRGDFMNYLAPTQNLKIQLKCFSPYVEMIDTMYDAGVISSMQSFSNTNQPFKVKLSSDIPSGLELTFLMKYTDTNYTAQDVFFLNVNEDFLNLDTNNVMTTVTSKSTIGYNDNINYKQGVGFKLEDSPSLLSCAGLLVGLSTNKVADNVYGITQLYETDFAPVQKVGFETPPSEGDKMIAGSFKDNGAGSPNIGLEVLHKEFAFNQPGNKNYIVLEFKVINTNDIPLDEVYIGYFADWDLPNRTQNKALTNTDGQFGYVFNLDSSYFTAIQLLSEGNFLHYAIDNNGQDGSVSLTDGFSSIEKYLALSGNRSSAGNYQFGNNVSEIVSTGPFFIAPLDTITVRFALHATSTYDELASSIEQAYQMQQGTQTVSHKQSETTSIQVYPNPFSSQVTIHSSAQPIQEVQIFDVTGREIRNIQVKISENSAVVNLSSLDEGIYFALVSGQTQTVVKLVKQKDK